jgi:hypothetical protein
LPRKALRKRGLRRLWLEVEAEQATEVEPAACDVPSLLWNDFELTVLEEPLEYLASPQGLFMRQPLEMGELYEKS